MVAALDPDSVPACDALGLWQRFDRMERSVGAAKVLLARKIDEAHDAARTGARSTPELLANLAGTTVGAARADLETSKQIRSLPDTDAALRDGRISRQQAEAIASAGAANPAAQAGLINTAATSTLRELQDTCARVRAAADPDPAGTARRAHAERSVRSWAAGAGVSHLHARGPSAEIAAIMAALAPHLDDAYNKARTEDRHEPREAYAFDALVALVRHGTPPMTANPRYLALLRVDLPTLVRGRGSTMVRSARSPATGPFPPSRPAYCSATPS